MQTLARPPPRAPRRARRRAARGACCSPRALFEVFAFAPLDGLAARWSSSAHHRAGRRAGRPAPLAGGAAARAVSGSSRCSRSVGKDVTDHIGGPVLLDAARGLHVGHAHRGRAPVGGRARSPRRTVVLGPASTPTRTASPSYLSTVCLIARRADPVRPGAAQPRAPQPRAAQPRRARRARARGGRRRRRARGAHAHRRRPPRRGRPRAQRDDRAGGAPRGGWPSATRSAPRRRSRSSRPPGARR